MQKLSAADIRTHLASLQGWQLNGNGIKKWKFRDFAAAMQFINRVADLAEKYDHHPEIFNVYDCVVLRYSTHSAGVLTEKDFTLPAEIDKIALNKMRSAPSLRMESFFQI